MDADLRKILKWTSVVFLVFVVLLMLVIPISALRRGEALIIVIFGIILFLSVLSIFAIDRLLFKKGIGKGTIIGAFWGLVSISGFYNLKQHGINNPIVAAIQFVIGIPVRISGIIMKIISPESYSATGIETITYLSIFFHLEN
jgi:hypothetical protein